MMPRHFQSFAAFAVLCGLALLLALAGVTPASAQENRTVMSLKVMTFNLRFASNTPPNAWPQRRPVMRECIQQTAPDVIGTQEGLYPQLNNIATDQPGYAWIGNGRDGGSRGEFMAIFYRKDRLEPLEYDYFWLSDTPDVVASSTWGNSCRRMVQWVKFRDRKTDAQFYFWNTHFDHEVQAAREKSAALVAQRVKALNTKLPVFLVGDFNAVSRANKAYDTLMQEGGFTDTWFNAKERIGTNYDTYHGYALPKTGGYHIDWILSQGPVSTESTQVIAFQKDGQYPSDHFPVLANVTLGQP